MAKAHISWDDCEDFWGVISGELDLVEFEVGVVTVVGGEVEGFEIEGWWDRKVGIRLLIVCTGWRANISDHILCFFLMIHRYITKYKAQVRHELVMQYTSEPVPGH